MTNYSFAIAVMLFITPCVKLMAQVNIYNVPRQIDVRKDVRINATIQNRMSTDEFMFRLAELRRAQELDNANSVAQCANETQNLYNSLGKYPSSLSNGWYNVTATDGKDFCKEYKVYVDGNKVKKAFIRDLYSRNIVFASQIENGKCIVKLHDGDNVSNYTTMYFIENIIEPNTRAAEHQEGYITFWTNDRKIKGAVKIYINGQEAGNFDSYFASGEPKCGQKGTYLFTGKPGQYHYRAECGKDFWESDFTIINGNCELRLLNAE